MSLRVARRRIFQNPESIGFVLTDDVGLVIAAEAGPFLDTLDPTDYSSFSITTGEPTCSDPPSSFPPSGGGEVLELLFRGGSTVAVGVASDGEFTIGTRRYGARNSGGAWRMDPCAAPVTSNEAPEGGIFWSVWREPTP